MRNNNGKCKDGKTGRKFKIFAISAGVLALGLAGALLLQNAAGRDKNELTKTAAANEPATVPSQADIGTIYYQGKQYKYNEDLQNILFMGIDRKEALPLQVNPGNAGQADAIMILTLDKRNKTVSVLQISRDTMTDITVYDALGTDYTTTYMQLATQYAFGTGGSNSCWAMKKTVSKLLYDLPVSGYISLGIDGIREMNDLVGGVTLTMPRDYSYIDPAFTEGQVVTLTGDQAERFVRYRDITITGSNTERMERQTQYFAEYLNLMLDKSQDTWYEEDNLLSELQPYMLTDLSEDELPEITGYQYEQRASYIPGEVRSGAEHDEFYVDETALKDLMINMFYKPVR